MRVVASTEIRTCDTHINNRRNMSMDEKVIDSHTTTWNPMNVFDCRRDFKYAVVVLNRPVCLPKSLLLPMWEKAEVTVTVDGGTDRWVEYLGDLAADTLSGKSDAYAPTLITGDMDSISSNALDNLRTVGSKVIMTKDQNLTDYTKALMELAKHCECQNIELKAIYVIVDTSGRFDHIVGTVNTLYKSQHIFENAQVIQVATDSLTWVLRPGKHRITIPEELVNAGDWCGLVPFGNRVDEITTTGLKWNLDNSTMEFGGLISTSNSYETGCKEVTIDVDKNIVWTMGIKTIMDGFDSS